MNLDIDFELSYHDYMVANSPTRDKYPLSPKKIVKKTMLSFIGYLILFLIIYGVVVFFLFVIKQEGYIFFSSIILILVTISTYILVYLYQKWYFNVYFYNLDPDFIVIRKGPITPHEITIPYQRIQDVYVDQDLWDRIFGLYDVHLSTATWTSGMEAHIDGVEKPAADGLRSTILETVSKKIGRHLDTALPNNGQDNH